MVSRKWGERLINCLGVLKISANSRRYKGQENNMYKKEDPGQGGLHLELYFICQIGSTISWQISAAIDNMRKDLKKTIVADNFAEGKLPPSVWRAMWSVVFLQGKIKNI